MLPVADMHAASADMVNVLADDVAIAPSGRAGHDNGVRRLPAALATAELDPLRLHAATLARQRGESRSGAARGREVQRAGPRRGPEVAIDFIPCMHAGVRGARDQAVIGDEGRSP